jgi:hypothetical protein
MLKGRSAGRRIATLVSVGMIVSRRIAERNETASHRQKCSRFVRVMSKRRGAQPD